MYEYTVGLYYIQICDADIRYQCHLCCYLLKVRNLKTYIPVKLHIGTITGALIMYLDGIENHVLTGGFFF